jgi:hypothetical protein
VKLGRRAAVGLTVTAALLWPVAGTATSGAASYTPLPAHVYAPF